MLKSTCRLVMLSALSVKSFDCRNQTNIWTWNGRPNTERPAKLENMYDTFVILIPTSSFVRRFKKGLALFANLYVPTVEFTLLYPRFFSLYNWLVCTKRSDTKVGIAYSWLVFHSISLKKMDRYPNKHIWSWVFTSQSILDSYHTEFLHPPVQDELLDLAPKNDLARLVEARMRRWGLRLLGNQGETMGWILEVMRFVWPMRPDWLSLMGVHDRYQWLEMAVDEELAVH